MSKALYRKYRSKNLDEVIGQNHITDILSKAIKSGRLSHAYLLTGPRGVGKTSVARILAYQINNIPYDEDVMNLDIIEIDAASNNGVEDVRELREKVQIAPSVASKKVYIIDEVHMLSKAAFNALLKTLEEPPEHVVFILATTNAEKLPATIISRTQRFNFRPISIDDAVKHLSSIAKQENIKITEDALHLIAQRSDGSFRDSISLLDQLSSLVTGDEQTITSKLIEDILGLAPSRTIDQIIETVEARDLTSIIPILYRTFNEGVNSIVLAEQLTERISKQIADKPQLLPLLDALIDVSKSPHPDLKLLSILGQAATPKQSVKSIALSAQTHEVSATIAELEEKAGLDLTANFKPSDSKSEQTTEEQIKTIKSKPASNNGDFDWDKLIEHTHQNQIALYSVLTKCNYELNEKSLTIYAGNKFYKRKLDDSKYNSRLNECLHNIGVYELDIHIIPSGPPLKDSQAAAVAVIMGGGEEVSLD